MNEGEEEEGEEKVPIRRPLENFVKITSFFEMSVSSPVSLLFLCVE